MDGAQICRSGGYLCCGGPDVGKHRGGGAGDPRHADHLSRQEREVSIQLENKGNDPVLVQSWLDLGDAAVAPSDIRCRSRCRRRFSAWMRTSARWCACYIAANPWPRIGSRCSGSISWKCRPGRRRKLLAVHLPHALESVFPTLLLGRRPGAGSAENALDGGEKPGSIIWKRITPRLISFPVQGRCAGLQPDAD